VGVSLAFVAVLAILTFVGVTGLVAAWSGAWPGDPPQDGSAAFFLLLGQLPAWVVGIVLVMVVSLSTAAFDSFQSAMVSTGSNDLFRNKLSLWMIRLAVVVIIVPVVVVALKSPNILQIYLISDLVSASLIPVLLVGLSEKFYWWRGFEVVVGGLGGIFTVFLFGTVYYGDARKGANLILLQGSLYAEDWSVFGEFVVFPIRFLVRCPAELTQVNRSVCCSSRRRFSLGDCGAGLAARHPVRACKAYQAALRCLRSGASCSVLERDFFPNGEGGCGWGRVKGKGQVLLKLGDWIGSSWVEVRSSMQRRI
jgi:hypothetical protein